MCFSDVVFCFSVKSHSMADSVFHLVLLLFFPSSIADFVVDCQSVVPSQSV